MRILELRQLRLLRACSFLLGPVASAGKRDARSAAGLRQGDVGYAYGLGELEQRGFPHFVEELFSLKGRYFVHWFIGRKRNRYHW